MLETLRIYVDRCGRSRPNCCLKNMFFWLWNRAAHCKGCNMNTFGLKNCISPKGHVDSCCRSQPCHCFQHVFLVMELISSLQGLQYMSRDNHDQFYQCDKLHLILKLQTVAQLSRWKPFFAIVRHLWWCFGVPSARPIMPSKLKPTWLNHCFQQLFLSMESACSLQGLQ